MSESEIRTRQDELIEMQREVLHQLYQECSQLIRETHDQLKLLYPLSNALQRFEGQIETTAITGNTALAQRYEKYAKWFRRILHCTANNECIEPHLADRPSDSGILPV